MKTCEYYQETHRIILNSQSIIAQTDDQYEGSAEENGHGNIPLAWGEKQFRKRLARLKRSRSSSNAKLEHPKLCHLIKEDDSGLSKATGDPDALRQFQAISKETRFQRENLLPLKGRAAVEVSGNEPTSRTEHVRISRSVNGHRITHSFTSKDPPEREPEKKLTNTSNVLLCSLITAKLLNYNDNSLCVDMECYEDPLNITTCKISEVGTHKEELYRKNFQESARDNKRLNYQNHKQREGSLCNNVENKRNSGRFLKQRRYKRFTNEAGKRNGEVGILNRRDGSICSGKSHGNGDASADFQSNSVKIYRKLLSAKLLGNDDVMDGMECYRCNSQEPVIMQNMGDGCNECDAVDYTGEEQEEGKRFNNEINHEALNICNVVKTKPNRSNDEVKTSTIENLSATLTSPRGSPEAPQNETCVGEGKLPLESCRSNKIPITRIMSGQTLIPNVDSTTLTKEDTLENQRRFGEDARSCVKSQRTVYNPNEQNDQPKSEIFSKKVQLSKLSEKRSQPKEKQRLRCSMVDVKNRIPVIVSNQSSRCDQGNRKPYGEGNMGLSTNGPKSFVRGHESLYGNPCKQETLTNELTSLGIIKEKSPTNFSDFKENTEPADGDDLLESLERMNREVMVKVDRNALFVGNSDTTTAKESYATFDVNGTIRSECKSEVLKKDHGFYQQPAGLDLINGNSYQNLKDIENCPHLKDIDDCQHLKDIDDNVDLMESEGCQILRYGDDCQSLKINEDCQNSKDRVRCKTLKIYGDCQNLKDRNGCQNLIDCDIHLSSATSQDIHSELNSYFEADVGFQKKRDVGTSARKCHHEDVNEKKKIVKDVNCINENDCGDDEEEEDRDNDVTYVDNGFEEGLEKDHVGYDHDDACDFNDVVGKEMEKSLWDNDDFEYVGDVEVEVSKDESEEDNDDGNNVNGVENREDVNFDVHSHSIVRRNISFHNHSEISKQANCHSRILQHCPPHEIIMEHESEIRSIEMESQGIKLSPSRMMISDLPNRDATPNLADIEDLNGTTMIRERKSETGSFKADKCPFQVPISTVTDEVCLNKKKTPQTPVTVGGIDNVHYNQVNTHEITPKMMAEEKSNNEGHEEREEKGDRSRSDLTVASTSLSYVSTPDDKYSPECNLNQSPWLYSPNQNLNLVKERDDSTSSETLSNLGQEYNNGLWEYLADSLHTIAVDDLHHHLSPNQPRSINGHATPCNALLDNVDSFSKSNLPPDSLPPLVKTYPPYSEVLSEATTFDRHCCSPASFNADDDLYPPVNNLNYSNDHMYDSNALNKATSSDRLDYLQEKYMNYRDIKNRVGNFMTKAFIKRVNLRASEDTKQAPKKVKQRIQSSFRNDKITSAVANNTKSIPSNRNETNMDGQCLLIGAPITVSSKLPSKRKKKVFRVKLKSKTKSKDDKRTYTCQPPKDENRGKCNSRDKGRLTMPPHKVSTVKTNRKKSALAHFSGIERPPKKKISVQDKVQTDTKGHGHTIREEMEEANQIVSNIEENPLSEPHSEFWQNSEALLAHSSTALHNDVEIMRREDGNCLRYGFGPWQGSQANSKRINKQTISNTEYKEGQSCARIKRSPFNTQRKEYITTMVFPFFPSIKCNENEQIQDVGNTGRYSPLPDKENVTSVSFGSGDNGIDSFKKHENDYNTLNDHSSVEFDHLNDVRLHQYPTKIEETDIKILSNRRTIDELPFTSRKGNEYQQGSKTYRSIISEAISNARAKADMFEGKKGTQQNMPLAYTKGLKPKRQREEQKNKLRCKEELRLPLIPLRGHGRILTMKQQSAAKNMNNNCGDDCIDEMEIGNMYGGRGDRMNEHTFQQDNFISCSLYSQCLNRPTNGETMINFEENANANPEMNTNNNKSRIPVLIRTRRMKTNSRNGNTSSVDINRIDLSSKSNGSLYQNQLSGTREERSNLMKGADLAHGSSNDILPSTCDLSSVPISEHLLGDLFYPDENVDSKHVFEKSNDFDKIGQATLENSGNDLTLTGGKDEGKRIGYVRVDIVEMYPVSRCEEIPHHVVRAESRQGDKLPCGDMILCHSPPLIQNHNLVEDCPKYPSLIDSSCQTPNVAPMEDGKDYPSPTNSSCQTPNVVPMEDGKESWHDSDDNKPNLDYLEIIHKKVYETNGNRAESGSPSPLEKKTISNSSGVSEDCKIDVDDSGKTETKNIDACTTTLTTPRPDSQHLDNIADTPSSIRIEVFSSSPPKHPSFLKESKPETDRGSTEHFPNLRSKDRMDSPSPCLKKRWPRPIKSIASPEMSRCLQSLPSRDDLRLRQRITFSTLDVSEESESASKGMLDQGVQHDDSCRHTVVLKEGGGDRKEGEEVVLMIEYPVASCRSSKDDVTPNVVNRNLELVKFRPIVVGKEEKRVRFKKGSLKFCTESLLPDFSRDGQSKSPLNTPTMFDETPVMSKEWDAVSVSRATPPEDEDKEDDEGCYYLEEDHINESIQADILPENSAIFHAINMDQTRNNVNDNYDENTQNENSFYATTESDVDNGIDQNSDVDSESSMAFELIKTPPKKMENIGRSQSNSSVKEYRGKKRRKRMSISTSPKLPPLSKRQAGKPHRQTMWKGYY